MTVLIFWICLGKIYSTTAWKSYGASWFIIALLKKWKVHVFTVEQNWAWTIGNLKLIWIHAVFQKHIPRTSYHLSSPKWQPEPSSPSRHTHWPDSAWLTTEAKPQFSSSISDYSEKCVCFHVLPTSKPFTDPHYTFSSLKSTYPGFSHVQA